MNDLDGLAPKRLIGGCPTGNESVPVTPEAVPGTPEAVAGTPEAVAGAAATKPEPTLAEVVLVLE